MKQTLFTKGSALMGGFSYRGSNVSVSFTADIPTEYKFGGAKAWAVEEALVSVAPWQGRSGTTATARLSSPVAAIVVAVDDREVIWGKHVGHKAKSVQVSPFVRLESPLLTTSFTVELLGDIRNPRLVRAYPGVYIPPLPWMISAEQVRGGVGRCIEFWRHNAYALSSGNMNASGSRAPSWYF